MTVTRGRERADAAPSEIASAGYRVDRAIAGHRIAVQERGDGR